LDYPPEILKIVQKEIYEWSKYNNDPLMHDIWKAIANFRMQYGTKSIKIIFETDEQQDCIIIRHDTNIRLHCEIIDEQIN
jgi:hypothetical protein